MNGLKSNSETMAGWEKSTEISGNWKRDSEGKLNENEILNSQMKIFN